MFKATAGTLVRVTTFSGHERDVFVMARVEFDDEKEGFDGLTVHPHTGELVTVWHYDEQVLGVIPAAAEVQS